MREQGRRDKRYEGEAASAAGEPYHEELKPLLWRAHVYEEMERLAREHEPAPGMHHFAEEYAKRAMRGVEADVNEYQRAAERGEKQGMDGGVSYLADAGDIAGG